MIKTRKEYTKHILWPLVIFLIAIIIRLCYYHFYTPLNDKFLAPLLDARAYYGNFLFSTGPNSEAGGSNNSACHVDIPMGHCSVSLDGEPMTIDGDVVAADQRVAKAA